MARIRLHQIAHARSGDKGDSSNVGLFVYTDEAYEVIHSEVTAERVKAHFGEIVRGRVDRFELPGLRALNFVLHDSLGGGGSESLKNDAQGKTHGQALLLMELEVPDDVLARYPARTSGPPSSGPSTSGPSAPGPSATGPSTLGPSTSGSSTSGSSTQGPSTPGPPTSKPPPSGSS